MDRSSSPQKTSHVVQDTKGFSLFSGPSTENPKNWDNGCITWTFRTLLKVREHIEKELKQEWWPITRWPPFHSQLKCLNRWSKEKIVWTEVWTHQQTPFHHYHMSTHDIYQFVWTTGICLVWTMFERYNGSVPDRFRSQLFGRNFERICLIAPNSPCRLRKSIQPVKTT